jgi:hypothetical protein
MKILEVDCRALRKRRQEPRSSAYYGISGLSSYPYFGYGLGTKYKQSEKN